MNSVKHDSTAYVLGFLPTYVSRELDELTQRGVNSLVLLPENCSTSTFWDRIVMSDDEKKPDGVRIFRIMPFSWFSCSFFLLMKESFQCLKGFFLHHPVRFTWAAWKAVGMGSFRFFLCGAYVAKFLELKKPERIHSHFAKESAHIGMWAAELLRLPFFFTTHANDIFVPDSIQRLAYLHEQASAVLTISHYNKEYITSKLGSEIADKIHVVHLGVDISSLSTISDSKKNKNKKFILCIASGFVEKKGVPYLIEACRLLKTRDIDFRCLIIGSDPSGETLQRMRNVVTKINLEDSVELPGLMTSDEVLRTLFSSDLFVLPSVEAINGDRDGIPVSLMEAMGMGIPSISTSISGIPELIENNLNGLLVPPGNSEALADAMEKILLDPSLADKLAENARRTISKGFSLQRYVDQLLNIWQTYC